MDVENQKCIKADQKEDKVKIDCMLQQQKKRLNIELPNKFSKRFKTVENNEEIVVHNTKMYNRKESVNDTGKVKKIGRRSNRIKYQTSNTLKQECKLDNEQCDSNDTDSFKIGKKNSLNVISSNVIKSLDKTFFAEDILDDTNIKSGTEDIENVKLIMPTITKMSNLFQQLNDTVERSDQNSNGIQITTEKLASETHNSIVSYTLKCNDDNALNEKEKGEKNREVKNESNNAILQQNKIHIENCMVPLHTESSMIEISKNNIEPLKIGTTKPIKYLEDKIELDFKSTTALDQINTDIEESDAVNNNSTIEIVNLISEVKNITSSNKDSGNKTIQNNNSILHISKTYSFEHENYQFKNRSEDDECTNNSLVTQESRFKKERNNKITENENDEKSNEINYAYSSKENRNPEEKQLGNSLWGQDIISKIDTEHSDKTNLTSSQIDEINKISEDEMMEIEDTDNETTNLKEGFPQNPSSEIDEINIFEHEIIEKEDANNDSNSKKEIPQKYPPEIDEINKISEDEMMEIEDTDNETTNLKEGIPQNSSSEIDEINIFEHEIIEKEDANNDSNSKKEIPQKYPPEKYEINKIPEDKKIEKGDTNNESANLNKEISKEQSLQINEINKISEDEMMKKDDINNESTNLKEQIPLKYFPQTAEINKISEDEMMDKKDTNNEIRNLKQKPSPQIDEILKDKMVEKDTNNESTNLKREIIQKQSHHIDEINKISEDEMMEKEYIINKTRNLKEEFIQMYSSQVDEMVVEKEITLKHFSQIDEINKIPKYEIIEKEDTTTQLTNLKEEIIQKQSPQINEISEDEMKKNEDTNNESRILKKEYIQKHSSQIDKISENEIVEKENTNNESTNLKEVVTQKHFSQIDEINKTLDDEISKLSEGEIMEEDVDNEVTNVKEGMIDKQFVQINEISKDEMTENKDTSNELIKNTLSSKKKLTLLYLSALDYAKEYKGYKKETYAETICSSTENNIYNTKTISVTSNKHSSENVLNKVYQKPDGKMNFQYDAEENSHNLNNCKETSSSYFTNDSVIQQNQVDTHYTTSDLKSSNMDTENCLIYDTFSMRSINSSQFQIKDEKYIIKNDLTEMYNKHSSIQPDCPQQQNNELYTERILSKISLNNQSIQDTKLSESPKKNETKMNYENNGNQNRCLEEAGMTFLVTAMDCFKTGTVRKEANCKTDDAEKVDKSTICTQQNDTIPCYDLDDSFEMDDDFTLTASQLSMIETDEKKASKEMKTSSQQTDDCSNTHFGLDSITVDVIDQLCYIRESVDSLKDLLKTALEKI